MDRNRINSNTSTQTDACKKTAYTVPCMLSDSFTHIVSGFANNNYWSSSEYNANNAWKQNFNNGNQNNNNKNNDKRVRCVRTFNQNTESDAYTGTQLTLNFEERSNSAVPEKHPVLLSEMRYTELAEVFEAYFECRKNKRYTANAIRFETDYESNLIELHNSINNGTYQPGRSIAFIVNKPVKREIFAASFADRVVHHLVIGKLNPLFEKHFIFDSYACRKDKGTHLGIKRLNRFIRAATCNYKQDAWILKLDIEAFFMNINKDILWKRLQPFIDENYLAQDKAILIDLCNKIVYNDCRTNCIIKGKQRDWSGLPSTKSLFSMPENKGIPIGNLTSQVFANFYLTPLDHFIKKTLGILKHYDTYELRKKMLSENLSAYYYNYLYISGGYAKMVKKVKRIK